MATLSELVEQEALYVLDPELGPTRKLERTFFALPPFAERVSSWLPDQGSTWNIEESPEEQLDALFEAYCSGEALKIGLQIKSLTHHGDGIWELKTADLRIFGWFVKRDCFVASAIDMAEKVKLVRLYRPYCEEAVRRRNALDLSGTKFIAGDDPNGIVSNYSYP